MTFNATFSSVDYHVLLILLSTPNVSPFCDMGSSVLLIPRNIITDLLLMMPYHRTGKRLVFITISIKHGYERKSVAIKISDQASQ